MQCVGGISSNCHGKPRSWIVEGFKAFRCAPNMLRSKGREQVLLYMYICLDLLKDDTLFLFDKNVHIKLGALKLANLVHVDY